MCLPLLSRFPTPAVSLSQTSSSGSSLLAVLDDNDNDNDEPAIMRRPSSGFNPGSSWLTTWSAVWVLVNVAATRWAPLLPGAGAVSVIAMRPDANAHTELDGHEIEDQGVSHTFPSLDSYRLHDTLQTASADPPPTHNHTKFCKFRREDYLFDLCPLLFPEWYNPNPGSGDSGGDGGDGDDQGMQKFVKRIEVKKETPPTVTHTHYYISMRGELDMSSKRWKGRECPEGTWICAVVVNFAHNGDKETDMRVLQVIPIAGNLPLEEGHSRTAHPGLNVSVRLVPIRKNRELHMVLHGGMYASRNQSALLRFQCNRSVEEPSSLQYAWTYNGFHVFTWASKHACASSTASPEPNEPEPAPDGPDPTPETPPDDIPADSGGGGDDGYGSGGGNESDDFVLPEDGGGMPNRQWWRVGIAGVMWTLALTLCSFYVLYALFPRLRVLVHTYVPLPTSVLNVLHSIPHPTMPSSISSSLSSLSQKVTAIPNINPFGSRRGRYRAARRSQGNFRPGERRLRSWAQEEGVLFDSGLGSYETVPSTEDVDLDLGGEEDFMINAGTSSLVESTDRGAPKVRSYGSVS